MFFSTRIVTFLAAFVGFWILYRMHAVASRDPTSVFFNPRLGYTPRYSAIRRHQAEDFIAAANTSSYDATFQKAHPNHRKICVGIPSMARKGARYLRDTVGSLLEGLTPEERREIYLTVFIPHSDPTVHPAYNEAWLPALADDVITYDVGEEGMKKVKVMEAEAGEYLEKGLYDYRYLLKHCGKQQTPYIAIFEDDIVAMDGWYHRTMAGIEEAEKKSALQHESSEFLYLRLFHTEEFLGWNSEEWRTYLSYSVIFFSVPMVLLLFFRIRNSGGKNIVTNRFLLVAASLITASIALFFAFGRVTVLPPPSGIHLMPKFGCCSQGHVFPRGRALMLTTFFADRHLGAPDVLIEDYANERGELRWAITPSVIQHVGRKSSKIDDYGPNSKHGLSVAEKIWNFAFERYDPVALRREHERVAKKASRS